MTTSTGKTLKRKQEDDAVNTDDVSVINDEVVTEKKITLESFAAESKSEITITPIPKVIEEKASGKDADVSTIVHV